MSHIDVGCAACLNLQQQWPSMPEVVALFCHKQCRGRRIINSCETSAVLPIQALRRERERRRREGAPDEVVAACERDILVLLLEYLQMQMQSGHTERAVACIQALLEFNCFSPDFPGASHPLPSLSHFSF